MTSVEARQPVRWPRLRFSSEFVRLFCRFWTALAVLHLLMQLCVWFPPELARTDSQRDVAIYFDAAMRLKNGVDVYQPWPQYGVQMTPTRFFYSPIFLVLTRPLVQMSYHDFARVWLVLVLGAFWVYAFCLSRLAVGKWDWKAALVFGMIINILLEGHSAVSLGQFEPFMWMLFGLALCTRHRAGFLGLATLVKIHPIWSLALALSEGGARAWKCAIAFVLPVVALSLWLTGTHNWAMWWPCAQPLASQGTFHGGNWSLSFLGLRGLHQWGWLRASGSLPTWAKAYLSLCAVGAPGATAFCARRWSRELRLSLVASAGVLFAPLCWGFYYPLLLLPLSVWLGERRAALAGAT